MMVGRPSCSLLLLKQECGGERGSGGHARVFPRSWTFPYRFDVASFLGPGESGRMRREGEARQAGRQSRASHSDTRLFAL